MVFRYFGYDGKWQIGMNSLDGCCGDNGFWPMTSDC